MAIVGYHASHEQHAPSRLLSFLQLAQKCGFSSATCSDHFHPWSERQGQSGFAWSWLGAALQATECRLGVVNAPGQRYHPAIIAQAAATLAEMYPDRFWLALGTGENLNEHITGDRWPTKTERYQRLLESVDVMRALWRGETVNHRGRITVEEAHLYTRPTTPPRIFGSALTPETAAWVATWADGLLTANRPMPLLKAIVDAFQKGGGRGKPMLLQVQLAYAPTDDEAKKAAYDEWRTNVFESCVLSSLRMPADFDAAAKLTPPDALLGPLLVSADRRRHLGWLQERLSLGFSEIYLHNVHRDQETFVRDFGERVLPELTH